MQKLRQGEESKAKRALDEFLVGNRELEKLTAILNKFNIFRVLGIEHTEIRHSNVLAWLLNPRESHGLSEIFIKRFLSTILMVNKKHGSKLSPAKVELMNLGDVEVWRERYNIDLLIYSKENEFVVLVENKIRAKERKGQLRKYLEIVKKNFKEAKSVISVLLTPEGELPSEEARELGYIPWNHRTLSDITTEIVEEQHDRIPQDAQIFLQHYLDVLRRETMQNQELVELCKSAYKNTSMLLNLLQIMVSPVSLSKLVKILSRSRAISGNLIKMQDLFGSSPKNGNKQCQIILLIVGCHLTQYRFGSNTVVMRNYIFI